jgi:hypothetical protein
LCSAEENLSALSDVVAKKILNAYVLARQLALLLKDSYYTLRGVCFSFLTLLWISFREIQKPEAEKLMERCFQLLVFRTIQFFSLSKANKKILKS